MVKGRKSGSRNSGESSVPEPVAAVEAPVESAGKTNAIGDVPIDALVSNLQAKGSHDKPHKSQKKKRPSATQNDMKQPQQSSHAPAQHSVKSRESSKGRKKDGKAAEQPSKSSKDYSSKKSDNAPDSTLPSVPLTPGNVSLSAPVWSHDGSLLLFPRSSGIRIMVRATNRPAGVLPVPSWAGTVMAVALHPRNTARFIALTSALNLLEFDYLDPRLLRASKIAPREKKSPSTVVALVPALVPRPGTSQEEGGDDTEKVPMAFAALSDGRVLSVDLSTGGRGKYDVLDKNNLHDDLNTMQVTTDGRLVVVAGKQGLYMARTQTLLSPEPSQRRWLKVVTKYPTTSLAVPSVSDTLATGDTNGVVRLWPGLLARGSFDRLAQQSKPVATSSHDSKSSPVAEVTGYVASTAMHWHPHPVRALAYARRDAVVLSGGEESTLVVWQIGASGGGGGNETKKEFAPRLPAFITAITPVPPPPVLTSAPQASTGGSRRNPAQSNESIGYYAITCADGSTAVLSASTLRLDQIYAPEGARSLDPALASSGPTASLGMPLSVSGNLALLPGPRPASVQLVEPSLDSHLLTLETAPDNRVGAKDDVLPEPVRTRVAALSLPSATALSSSLQVWTKVSLPPWLATVESRMAAIRSDGTLVEQEQALVFWHSKPSTLGYQLASRIERPHKARVTQAVFAPPPNGPAVDPTPRLATASQDGSVRLWNLASRPSARGAVRSWRLGAALAFRNAQPTSMAWDARGEVLAVGWSYDPNTSTYAGGERAWGAVTLVDASPQAMASGSAGILRTFPVGTMGLKSVSHLAWTSPTTVVRTLVASSPTAVAVLDVLEGSCVARGVVGGGKRSKQVLTLLPPLDQPSSKTLVGWIVLATHEQRSQSESMELVALSYRSPKPEAPAAIRTSIVGHLPRLRSVVPLSVPAQLPSEASVAARTPHTVLLGLSHDLNVFAFGTAPLPPAARVLRESLSGAQPSLWAQLVGPAPDAARVPGDDKPVGSSARIGGKATDAHAGLALLKPFDAPAHLLPSVGSLLRSVQQALLPPAPHSSSQDQGEPAAKDEDGDTAFRDTISPGSAVIEGSSSTYTTAPAPPSAVQTSRAQSTQAVLGTSEGLEFITSALTNFILEDRSDVKVVEPSVQAQSPGSQTANAAAPQAKDKQDLDPTVDHTPDVSMASAGGRKPGKTNARKRKARASEQ